MAAIVTKAAPSSIQSIFVDRKPPYLHLMRQRYKSYLAIHYPFQKVRQWKVQINAVIPRAAHPQP